jgi:hypothetical protein
MQQDIEYAKTRAANLRKYLAAKGVQMSASETLEALSAQEGAADWNTYRAALSAAPHGEEMFCPYCGHRGKVRSIGSAFIEQGPERKDGYMFEGDATQFECGSCFRQFVDWEGGGALYARRDELILLVKREDEAVTAKAISLMTLAKTMDLLDLASVSDYLEECSAEKLERDLADNTWGGPDYEFVVTGATLNAVLKLAREDTPVFKVFATDEDMRGLEGASNGQFAAESGSSDAADASAPSKGRAAGAVIPDFAALADKRMSELTPQQQRDAHEGWIRAQLGSFDEHTQRQLQVLLTQLDVARSAAVVNPE